MFLNIYVYDEYVLKYTTIHYRVIIAIIITLLNTKLLLLPSSKNGIQVKHFTSNYSCHFSLVYSFLYI